MKLWCCQNHNISFWPHFCHGTSDGKGRRAVETLFLFTSFCSLQYRKVERIEHRQIVDCAQSCSCTIDYTCCHALAGAHCGSLRYQVQREEPKKKHGSVFQKSKQLTLIPNFNTWSAFTMTHTLIMR